MTDPSPPRGLRLGADALSPEERDVQRALGADSPPAPRRSDAAFAARVADARRGPGHRWAFASVPLAAAAAFALFVGVPEPAPPAATGAELYALTLQALDDDDTWTADTFDALLDDEFDETLEQETGSESAPDYFDNDAFDGDVDFDDDEPLSTAVTTLAATDTFDAFDDDDLAFLDGVLDEELTD